MVNYTYPEQETKSKKLSELEPGTVFYVKNGDWSGRIVLDRNGEKCIQYMGSASDIVRPLSEFEPEPEYYLSLDFTQKTINVKVKLDLFVMGQTVHLNFNLDMPAIYPNKVILEQAKQRTHGLFAAMLTDECRITVERYSF